ncbi:transporter substrate-binding domain-containing protein [Microbulbifer taiwanensis]|uniref:transporter substrate-binding domain-containing protein n=1 Tax=Microbulbifer taiwanensis TaxID=986746 RepID=UPI00362280BD
MHTALRCLLPGLLLVLFCAVTGCDRSVPEPEAPKEDALESADQSTGQSAETADDQGSVAWVPEIMGEYPIGEYDNYTETGDLEAISKRGQLRILVDIANTQSLHRAATRQDIEIDQVKRLAERLDLEPVVLYADSFTQLIELLRSGQADIIANDMAITEERRQLVDFSTPVSHPGWCLFRKAASPPSGRTTDCREKPSGSPPAPSSRKKPGSLPASTLT